MKNFVSVSTGAARFQDISLNPQKLAGMCAKLKCCLNYEVDTYIEAGRRMPSKEIVLQTQDSDYYVFKTDILAGIVTYSTDKRIAANLETITAARALEIIEMNKRGEKPASLTDEQEQPTDNRPADLLTGDINRFDRSKKKKKKSANKQASNKQNAKAQAESAKEQQPNQPKDKQQQSNQPKDKQPDKGKQTAPADKNKDKQQGEKAKQPRQPRQPKRQPNDNRAKGNAAPNGEQKPQQPPQPKTE